MPSGVIGASTGAIGTAVARQQLRGFMTEFHQFIARVRMVIPRVG